MEPIRLEEIAAATAGRLVAGDPGALVSGISTDSRTIRMDELFIPLAGQRYDGHDFVAAALERGAKAVLCAAHRQDVQDACRQGRQKVGLVVVDDTLAAFQRLARHHRSKFDIPVVAVTGSNGKTTTKDMIAAILARRWRTEKSQGNFNNEVGVPLTLLRLERGVGALVVEMGMRSAGEIAQLARCARPTVGVVTNVGPVHLELLGSIERIAAAKSELPEALGSDGWAVLNADDAWVRWMASRTPARPVWYGLGEGADVRAGDVTSRGEAGVEFTLHWRGAARRMAVPIAGRHNVYNALAAAATALVLGLGLDAVADGLRAAADDRSAMRMDIRDTPGGLKVINDAYNASPASMLSALETLAEVEAARRIAVLGDMLELGPLAEEAHRQVGERVAQLGVDLLVTVGSLARSIAAAAQAAGMAPQRTVHCDSAEEAARAVARWVRSGDAVLVKASRGVRLEQVAEVLQAASPGEA